MENFKKSVGITTNTSTFFLIFNIKFSGYPNSLGAKLHEISCQTVPHMHLQYCERHNLRVRLLPQRLCLSSFRHGQPLMYI